MREIKFRQPIYNKDGSFKEWFYWGLFKDTGEWVNIHCPSKQVVVNQIITDPFQSEQLLAYDKDKNEVYENDIVTDGQDDFLVWRDDNSLLIGGLKKDWDEYLGVHIHRVKVKGNIRQNPELLGE